MAVYNYQVGEYRKTELFLKVHSNGTIATGHEKFMLHTWGKKIILQVVKHGIGTQRRRGISMTGDIQMRDMAVINLF